MIGFLECFDSIGDMFKYIEHYDPIELLIRLIGVIKESNMDSMKVVSGGVYDPIVGFDAVDFTESTEIWKEQTVTTSDVKDLTGFQTTFLLLPASKQAQDVGSSALPPPVLVVELPVCVGILGVHLALFLMT